MKTAISIPDQVFESAEQLASRTGQSRSQLYTRALCNYLATHKKEGVTKKLNKVYASSYPGVDKVLGRMQSQSLPKETW